MQTSVTLGLIEDREADTLIKEKGERLLILEARTSGSPTLTDYTSLLQACCDAIRPILDGLHNQGYSMWLFLAGAEMTPDRRASYPNYSLFSPAEKLGVEMGKLIEHEFKRDGKVRTAGLYQVRADQYVNACEFMTRNSWSLAILSQREDLATLDSLNAIYRVAALDNSGEEMRSLDCVTASTLLAPLGDVVFRTLGSADAKYRSLVMTCSKTSRAADFFITKAGGQPPQ